MRFDFFKLVPKGAFVIEKLVRFVVDECKPSKMRVNPKDGSIEFIWEKDLGDPGVDA